MFPWFEIVYEDTYILWFPPSIPIKFGFCPLNIVGKVELSRIHVKSFAFDLLIAPPPVFVAPKVKLSSLTTVVSSLKRMNPPLAEK